MAGTYADVPAARIAYDRNGSIGATIDNGNTITALTGPQMINLNDESDSSLAITAYMKVAIIFPALHDIYASYFNATGAAGYIQEVSVNTTNGLDGTWTTFRGAVANGATTNPDYRASIYTPGSPSMGIKGYRLRFLDLTSPSVYNIHLFGNPSASSDRLEFWHPTLDQPLSTTPAYFDYGDVPRNASNFERDFRVKNLSASLTANSVTIGCEALTDSTPTYVSQTEFRYNGGSYAATASIPSIAPNTISPLCTAKFDISATATLGVWAQRYFATASTWS